MIRNDRTSEAKEEMKRKLIMALEEMGLQCESYAKLELENDPRRIDTGNLRNSISHEVVPDENSVYIGTDVEYGLYVHEGSDRMRPNRFLRNAVTNNAAQYKEIAEKVFRE